MESPERPLNDLAHRFQTTFADSPRRMREELAQTLEPMIRCAIRTGLGQAPLVAWVQKELRERRDDGADPLRLSGPLARALCELLLAQSGPPCARETVLGA